MTDPLFTSLTNRALEQNSLLCVGLDPHPKLLESPSATAARDFCFRLIDACHPFVAAFKPNSAFFELWGAEGVAALAEVIAAVPDSIPVILDAKRGDIASTAKAYARAAFDTLGVDALTINPYLGYDSIKPFLIRPERGVFVLCKTSNPGADEFQALSVGPEPLYLRVARQALEWRERCGWNNLGLVVGATDPRALARVREVAPDLWFLAPGVGAQGGDLPTALAAGLRADGLGMLVTVSRSVALSPDANLAARNLRDSINQGRRSLALQGDTRPRVPAPAVSEALKDELATVLLQSGCVRFGDFALKSGRRSPIYLDLRRLASHPRALQIVAAAMLPLLRDLQFDRLAAIPYAALPIGTALALAGNWPLIYPRREAKSYGTRSLIEGEYRTGDQVVVIDDLVTSGESKVEAIRKLEAEKLLVRDVLVLIDREQGATAVMASAGHRLHAVVTLSELLDRWRAADAISADQYEKVKKYLEG